jgi:hypothetical protein
LDLLDEYAASEPSNSAEGPGQFVFLDGFEEVHGLGNFWAERVLKLSSVTANSFENAVRRTMVILACRLHYSSIAATRRLFERGL